MSWVEPNMIKIARRADLYAFLLTYHSQEVRKEGKSLRLLSNHSISIKQGYSGYRDFATGETGNSVDCLVRYFRYSMQDAVIALCGGQDCQLSSFAEFSSSADVCSSLIGKKQPFSLPEPLHGPYKQLFAYLVQVRYIPVALIQRLIANGLMYQTRDHANIAFVNPEGTFYELRGTNTFKPFHQVQFSNETAFWWFKTGNDLFADPVIAYVCEAAIDAMSLYCLHQAGQAYPSSGNALYCSIGGVGNQQRIDAIKAGMSAGACPTVLSVDNDLAGEQCRQRNLECGAIIPIRKDWNEDWMAFIEQNHSEE